MVVASAGWEITICVGWAYAVEATSSSASRQAKIFIGLLRGESSLLPLHGQSPFSGPLTPLPRGERDENESLARGVSYPSPPLGERAALRAKTLASSGEARAE